MSVVAFKNKKYIITVKSSSDAVRISRMVSKLVLNEYPPSGWENMQEVHRQVKDFIKDHPGFNMVGSEHDVV